MGSHIEVNDTLQISREEGFPGEVLDFLAHQQTPVNIESLKGRLFSFRDKKGARIYHLDPVRVFLVENINGKWLFWGKCVIESQTIYKDLDAEKNWHGEWLTKGRFEITDIYESEYQKIFTERESPAGKNYFST